MNGDVIIKVFFWVLSLKTVKTSCTSQGVFQGQPFPHATQILSQKYVLDQGYDKNSRPSSLTDVHVALYINRISGVDETKEELSFDVFLKVIWMDSRIRPKEEDNVDPSKYIQLTSEERHMIWVPDLYIRQLREMKVQTLFEEISSLRLYPNSTISLSIGATIIIKCDMDFVLYPLDVQKCAVDFSSYKYTVDDMVFKWREVQPLMFPNDFGDGFFRLPKYVVSFYHSNITHSVNYGDADHGSARLEITLSREVKSYLLENYLPSTLFVSISWGSFVVVPDIVPGRMVLLVTTLLSLVTMFDTVRNNSPDALELKCIEVWLISCTLFVFLALMEYFIVLFGIRYDKHWRTVNKSLGGGVPRRPTPSPIRLRSATNSTVQIHNEAPFMLPMTPSSSLSATQIRRNGLFNRNKVNPEGSNKDFLQPDNSAAVDGPASIAADDVETRTPTTAFTEGTNNNSKRRFKNVAEYALLYAGSQRGRLDQISLILFPLSFLMFTIIYWIYYLSESRKKL